MIKEGFTLLQHILHGFNKENQMIEYIALCCPLAVQNLACRLSFFEYDLCEDQGQNDVDRDTQVPLMDGLSPQDSLNQIKMIGAIVNPVFQNFKWIEAAKLCTKEQYIEGKNKLLTRMKQMINFSNSDSTVLVDDGSENVGNKWDQPDNQYDNLATSESTLTTQNELKIFYDQKSGRFYRKSIQKQILETMMNKEMN